MEGLHFVGLPDDGREPVGPDDYRRLAVSIQEAGFTLCDGPPTPSDAPANTIDAAQVPDTESGRTGTLRLWRDGFEPMVAMEDNWMVHVIDPWTPVEVDRTWLDPLVPLIGITTDVADTYIGWVSSSDDDDLWFIVEDPPFELTEPLAVVYVGQRYLDDNGPPAFARGAELDVALPRGRLIVPSFDELR